MVGLTVLVVFVVLICLKVPVAVSMGLCAAGYLLCKDLPISVLAQRMVNAISYSYPLLAVPLFIFVGYLMNELDLSTKLFEFVKLFIGRIRGGLAYVNVLASLIFAGISGAALADIAGLGNIEMKAMLDEGYSKEDAACVTAASATIGPIFPPSIPLIVYATVAEVSGIKLLMAGVFPGILVALLLMLLVAILAPKRNYPVSQIALPKREKARRLITSLPIVFLPFLLLIGLLSGYFGPTELGAMAVGYSLLLGIIYKTFAWEKLRKAIKQTAHSVSAIMLTVAAASVFSWVLTVEQVPSYLTSVFLGISQNKYVLLLLINVLLLLIGTIMESMSAILVITPIIAPMLTEVGVHPLQLGIIVVLNLMIGLLTPPVGLSLYAMTTVSGLPFHKFCKAIVVWMIPLLLALGLVTLVPHLSIWLPEFVFAKLVK
nr:TRAP transporter large permease [Candidatus Calescibacterium sp.]